jgi:hypothetical protein
LREGASFLVIKPVIGTTVLEGGGGGEWEGREGRGGGGGSLLVARQLVQLAAQGCVGMWV